jgi:hypothetical protein
MDDAPHGGGARATTEKPISAWNGAGVLVMSVRTGTYRAVALGGSVECGAGGTGELQLIIGTAAMLM